MEHNKVCENLFKFLTLFMYVSIHSKNNIYNYIYYKLLNTPLMLKKYCSILF